jgi:hypothetical protein
MKGGVITELPCSEEVPEVDDPGVHGLQSSYPTRWTRMIFSPNFPVDGVEGMRLGDKKSQSSVTCPAFITKNQYSMALGRASGISIHTQQVRN